MLSRILQRHKALPDQAGFIRRGLAFTVDIIIISLLSLLIYVTFTELKARASGEQGIIAQMSQAFKEGTDFSIRLKEDKKEERTLKYDFLKILKGRIPYEEYELALDHVIGHCPCIVPGPIYIICCLVIYDSGIDS